MAFVPDSFGFGPIWVKYSMAQIMRVIDIHSDQSTTRPNMGILTQSKVA